MKVLKIVGIIVAAIIILPLLAGLVMKKEYHVERSLTINAPQARVHQEISNLRNINTWSPFLEKYKDSQVTYDGQDGAVGSSSSWSGKESGSGTQTITAISPEQVKLRLDFKEPMENTAMGAYTLAPEGEGTKVTWSMDGQNPYPWNVMVPMMDGMLGADFDRGLTLLKSKLEGTPAPPLEK